MAIDEDLARALGAELAALRIRRGLSQPRAVEEYERVNGDILSRRSLVSYENATRAVKVDRLVKLANTYQVNASMLLAAALQRIEQK